MSNANRRWLFRTYVQWHAIAFLLSELCVRVEGEDVERAWKAIEFIVNRRWIDDQQITHKMKGHLWKPLRRLMDRARTEHDKATAARAQKEQQSAQSESSQVQASMSAFDPAAPVDPIMNMDLSVDRLYPVGAITSDTSTDWTDPRMDMNGFTASTTLSAAPATVPTSVDQIMGSDEFPPGFDLSDDWLLNGDAHIASQGLANPTFTDPAALPAVTTTSLPTVPLLTSPLLPDGSVDWANWDDMVQQFGMDVDQTAQGDPAFGGFSQWY